VSYKLLTDNLRKIWFLPVTFPNLKPSDFVVLPESPFNLIRWGSKSLCLDAEPVLTWFVPNREVNHEFNLGILGAIVPTRTAHSYVLLYLNNSNLICLLPQLKERAYGTLQLRPMGMSKATKAGGVAVLRFSGQLFVVTAVDCVLE
jgi:hypothetical protein